jgi:hypothetical protein
MQTNRSTFSILFYINTSKTKKSGKCPILGRISIDGENTAFSTGLDILPDEWNANKGLSRSNSIINRQIEQFRTETGRHYKNMLENKGYVTAEMLKNALRGKAYMDKLGYGNQPYIVLKHSDIKREHLHIISLRVDESGRKINDSYEVARSMKICKELEQQFNLVPLVKGEREFEIPKPINYKDGDLKHKAGNTIKFVLGNFYFQSFGEYKTMLEHFNLTAEEVKGLRNGILYSVTDEKRNKAGRPFKSSLFGKEAGYEALQKHYENSKTAIEKKKIREALRPIITKAMQTAKNRNDFEKLLKENRIGVIFRENGEKRIYGVTFIDFQNRTILNGSRLGKEFSANVFNDLFNNPHKQIDILTDKPKQEQIHQNINSVSSLGSVFGLFDIPQSGNDYEEENFVREHRRKKPQKKRGRGI